MFLIFGMDVDYLPEKKICGESCDDFYFCHVGTYCSYDRFDLRLAEPGTFCRVELERERKSLCGELDKNYPE